LDGAVAPAEGRIDVNETTMTAGPLGGLSASKRDLIWSTTYAVACGTGADGHAAEGRADRAVEHAAATEARRQAEAQKIADELAAQKEAREEAGMVDVADPVYAHRLSAWEATLGTFMTALGSGHGKELAGAWGALSVEQQQAVDAGEPWPGGTHQERLARELRARSGMADVPMDVWLPRWSGCSAPTPETFGETWRALADHQQQAIDAGATWGDIVVALPLLYGAAFAAPGIFAVWEAFARFERESFGCIVSGSEGTGLFVRAIDAVRASTMPDGPARRISARSIVTLDGRVGWPVPDDGYGGVQPAVPLHEDLDGFFLLCAREKLTPEERAALLTEETAPKAGPAQGPGVVLAWKAVRWNNVGRLWETAGFFLDEADARAAIAGTRGSGHDDAVKQVPFLTLDGREGWPLDQGKGEPVVLWHDLGAHLRDRALKKLSAEEQRAHGLPLEGALASAAG
jgi:hypothetical protein